MADKLALTIPRGVATAARSAAKSMPGGTWLRKALIGRGGDAVDPTKRIVGRWGGLDEDILDAKRLKERFQEAGFKGDLGMGEGATLSRDRINKIEAALPGVVSSMPNLTRGLRGQTTGELQQQLGGLGVDLTGRQAKALQAFNSPLRSAGRQARRMVLGDRPLETTYQRFLQGGLVGKGGVLLGDAAPGGHLGRAYKRVGEQLDKGEYMKALGEVPKMHTGGYAMNTAFGYGLPLAFGYGAYQDAQERGEDPLRALGANATSAVGSVLMAPLGLAQMGMFEPMERGAAKLWGATDPYTLEENSAEPERESFSQHALRRQGPQRERSPSYAQGSIARVPRILNRTAYQTALAAQGGG